MVYDLETYGLRPGNIRFTTWKHTVYNCLKVININRQFICAVRTEDIRRMNGRFNK